jgi:hypothetical protein
VHSNVHVVFGVGVDWGSICCAESGAPAGCRGCACALVWVQVYLQLLLMYMELCMYRVDLYRVLRLLGCSTPSWLGV